MPHGIGLTDQQLTSGLLKSVLITQLTARFLLPETYRVKLDEDVLMHAAAGAMGHTLCPWARHLGVTVIDTARTEEEARRLRVTLAATTASTIRRKASRNALFITYPAMWDCLTPRSARLSSVNAQFAALE